MALKGLVGSLIYFAASLPLASAAPAKQTFHATARTRDGSVVYIEKHELFFDEKDQIQSASTTYERESGEVIATLKSDFSHSLATPDHVAENRLNGDRYGVRHDGQNLIMFKQDGKDQKEKSRALKVGFSGDSLAVAGQGINYYIQANLDKIRAEKTTALTLLIPGRLKYFAFKMEVVSEADGILNIEFTASNFFIRLFVPKLKVQFDVKQHRLIRYEGVSNIADHDGEIRDVVIDYDYTS